MSRLDAALQSHEKTLRNELTLAQKKQTELEGELARQIILISQTQNDLHEVEKELERRGIETHRQTPHNITEEEY